MPNYKLKTKEEVVMETSEGKTKKKFLKSEKVKKNYYSGIWSIFVHADTMDKWLTLIGIVSCFGDGISMPLMVLVTGKIINNLGGASSMSVSEDFIDGINKKSLVMVYLAIAKLLLGFLVGFCWTRTGERQASKMRLHYLKSILRQDIEYFDLKEVSTSDVITSVSTDTLVVQDALSEKIPTFITSCSTFFGCIMVGFFEVWRLAVMTFPTMILLVLPSLVYGRMMISLARKNRVEYNKAGVVAEQAISSIRTVYSFVGEKSTISKFSKALMGPLKLGLKQGLLKGIAIGSNSFVFAIWAFVSWYGSRLVMYHGVKGGNVYVVGVTVIVGGLSLGSGLSTIKYISEAASAGQRVMEVMSRTPKIDSNSTEGETLKSISGDIEFNEVQFAYPSRPDSPILRSFTLNVPSKKTVALVGSSGSGKSTVIALLERFYDPSSGSILLDGVDVRRLNLKWMRSQMGLVSQEPVLFAMSIKDNLMFGKDDASMEEVVAAAKAANAHGFISELPAGYDTQVGEGGIQMSGGQKQRLAIARAIINSPKILLLDEATSALDTDSERIVQNALDRASVDRTTIVVAHRLSTIHNSDIIAVVQSGRVVESGSHDSLLSMDCGVYASLVRLQQIETVQDEFALESSRNFLVTRSSSTRLLDAPRASKVDPNFIEQPPSKTLVPTFRRLLSLNVPEWKHALIGCLNALVFGVIQPMYAYNNGAMISVYFLQDHSEIKRKTRIYSLIFTAVSVLSFLTSIGQHYNLGAMGEHLTKRVREQVLMKMLTFEVGWFDRDENSTGAICSRLANDANLVRSLVGDRIALLIQTMSSVLLAFTLSLIISWRLSVIMIAIQPLIIVCFYARRVLLKSMSSKGMKAQSESSKLAAEAVSNLRTVTAFSSQERILRLFESAQDGPRRENVRQSWIAGVVLGLSQALVACSWALNFWYGGKLVSKGYITPKAIFQTYTILITTGRTIADAGSMTTDLASGASAIASLFSILDRTTFIDPEDPNGYVPDKLNGRIEFCNVDFAYPARPSVVIFRGLSLIIDARKSTALVGQSGSGKSTVIGLIERFYDPLSGVVTIDGRDVKSYHLRLLREQIALVGQEPTLFSGNIRENIMYGMENAKESEMEDAARAANAHEFITGLKEGYNTFCGDRGIQLSGGQKQRIAIARAVLRNPTILLLDEATSALDGRSEKVVQEALERMMVGRTSVVVAHQLATVRNCNEIVVLEKGVVVEKGSHGSLTRKGSQGVYYGMVKLQQVHSKETT